MVVPSSSVNMERLKDRNVEAQAKKRLFYKKKRVLVKLFLAYYLKAHYYLKFFHYLNITVD